MNLKQNRLVKTQFLLKGLCVLFAVCSSILSISTYADVIFKHGAVMARTFVLDENNQPILVEFNEDGSEGNVINIPDEYKKRVFELPIINAADYRLQTEQLKDYLQHYANTLAVDAKLMSRDDYLSQTYTTADGKQEILPAPLPAYVKSVLVRGRSNRILNSPYDLVLSSFSVDLTQNFTPPDKGTLLLNPKGQVITSSSLNIAPRVGFFGDPKKKQEMLAFTRKYDDKIFGPVPYTKVYVAPDVFPGSIDVTDEQGKYSMMYSLGFCPFYMDMETDMWAELHYANFSPKGIPILPFYLRRQDWSGCWDPQFVTIGTLLGAMAYIDVLGIKASMALPNYAIDMKVDVMFLSGKVYLKNPDGSDIAIGDKTEYSAESPDPKLVTQQLYDLDGDGRPDGSVLGKIVSQPQPDGTSANVFEADAENGNIQGIYLSSHGGNNGQPDLYRQADNKKKFTSNGLLKSISKDDLKKTDVLVFRESTGELVLERQGLQDAEIDGRLQEGLGKDDKNFFYRIMLRGPQDSALNVGGTNRAGTWQEWATRNKLAEPFRKRESDYLKSGEWIRLVVINRVTGYMGTQRILLSDASKNAYGLLNVPVSDTYLTPPNLKVWAERSYSVDGGLTAGDDKNYVIGAEGASLTSDAKIQVYTEWYDEDNRPLPEGLGANEGAQYGLTGRLAHVISDNVLSAVAEGQLANFPIAPGHHTQVLRVRDNLASPEHFYIHVSGTQKDEKPDFGTGLSSPPFDSRPRGLTPFFTPIFDESTDWYTITAWNQARQVFNANESNVRPLKPLPSFVWALRPEYQFSQYELAVKDIKRTSAEGATTSLLDDPKSLVGVSDELLDIFYSLNAARVDRLTPIDGPQELVLTVGEDEQKITIGADKQLSFSNLAHLAYLHPEDFLTIRLYSNQDAGNVLWEYAFDIFEKAHLSRDYAIGQFNDQPALTLNMIDSFQVLNIPLDTESTVQVELLDHDKKPVTTLVSPKVFPLGLQHVVVLRKDMQDLQPQEGVDAYIIVKTTPLNGNRAREKTYEVELTTQISGEMLGQIIEYDTLIQRGALTLHREDLAIPSPGPALDFSRSYSNETKPENSKSILGPGWSDNHEIYVQVLATGDNEPPYENSLPGWIKNTRESDSKPKILDHETLMNLMTKPKIPTMVAVSNGGSFKRVGNTWIAQRGNHGTLEQSNDGSWLYISKDGTQYNFESLVTNNKSYVSTVTDRNGNVLTYKYGMVDGERLVLSVEDAAARKLNFSYDLADNGHVQLTSVVSSVGQTLEFSYFKRPKDGYDPRVGMLQSFKRGTFTESYDYSHLPADSAVNLSMVIDANGHSTRYEYYDQADVPDQLEKFAPGLNKNDVVHKVYYNEGTDQAEIKYPVTASENRREVVDLRSNTKKYTLNWIGNPTKIDEPLGKSTTFQWSADMGEADNLLRKKKDLATGADWEYQYDAKGNLAKEIDPYGNATLQVWDQQFAVMLHRTDKNGNTLDQTIDAKGNVLSEKQTAVINGSGGTVTTKHTYGAGGSYKGVLLSTVDGAGGNTTFNYDTYGLPTSITAPEGSVTGYENNSRGLKLSEIDPGGNKTVFTYDDLDRLLTKTDAEGNSVEYKYDNKGNKKSEETRDSYLVDGTKHTRYLKLTYSYDARDRVETVSRSGNLDGNSSLGGGKHYSYDPNSNLLSDSDWKGVANNYTYDALNRKISTTNRSGNAETYQYVFGDGLKTTTIDVGGHVATEYADKLGRKTKIVRSSVQRLFEYDNLTNVTSVTDENGHKTNFTYDGRNLKIAQINAEGNTYQWQYDGLGNTTKTIDEANRKTTFVYDKQSRLIEKQLPEHQIWRYSYNPSGTIATSTDPWGFEKSFSYNTINQRTGTTNPDSGVEVESHTLDGDLVFQKDALGNKSIRLIGPEKRIVSTIDAVGRTAAFDYDDNNNQTDSHLTWDGAVAGPGSVSSHSEYDVEDRLISHDSAFGSSVAQHTQYKYDNLGNRLETNEPNGRTTKYEYDDLNRVITMTDALNHAMAQTWDGVGNKLTVTDRRGNTTTTYYDALNRPTKVQYADGTFISSSYDPVGNVVSTKNRRGFSTDHTYDGLNREITRTANGTIRLLTNEYDVGGAKSQAITDANGNRVVSISDWRGDTTTTTFADGTQKVNEFDLAGRMVSSKDASNLTEHYTYYADGSVASSANPIGETTQFSYDIFKNKARIVKPLGGEQLTEYDEQNRLVKITDALNGVTRYGYDNNNNLTHQHLAANDAGEADVEYTYDLLNRKLQHIQHKGAGSLTTTFTYDAEGNLVQTIDPKGQTFAQTFDSMNRVTEETFPAGDISSISTAYDENGNPKTITEHKSTGTETTQNTYDLLDRLTNQDQRGHLISYQYDNNGNRTRVTSPGGDTGYTYDTLNRLKTVNSGGTTSTYQYIANGWLQQVVHANGTKVTYTYDDAGRTKTIVNSLANGDVLSQFAYNYDANGNRTQQVETQNGFLTVQTQTTDYTFDHLDRIQNYRETAGSVITEHSFTYFPSYDRKSETIVTNGVTVKARDYSYDETRWLNKITESAAGKVGTITYNYDANGNTTHKTDTTSGSAVSTVFTYNPRNQLKSVAQGAPGAEVGQGAHDYNYMGMRIRHLGSERGDVEYIYDGASVIDEIQNNSNVQIAHYRYGDRLLSLTTTGGDQFYHYAALGTTANLTNAAGQKQVAYRTDAFGDITKQEGTSINRHVFTGKEHDEKTGLIYFGARFYDPDTARFINQDSYLGVGNNPPSLHRYLYAYANPTIYIDQDGHFVNLITAAIGAAIGGIGGCIVGSMSGTGCGKGAAVGAVAGGLAGLTFGASMAATAALGIGAEGGSMLVAATVSGAVGGYTGGAGNTLASGGSLSEANQAGLMAAPVGAVGGLVGMAVGGSTSSLLANRGASALVSNTVGGAVGGVAGDAASQGVNIAAGTQEKFDFKQMALSGGLGGAVGAAFTPRGANNRTVEQQAQRAVQETEPGLTVESANRGSAFSNQEPVPSQPRGHSVDRVCCFVAGTPVETPVGKKAIETIVLGELVYSKNPETGEKALKPVTHLFKKFRPIYEVIVVNSTGETNTIETTEDHPFYVVNVGWVHASHLQVGDEIETDSKGPRVYVVSGRETDRVTTTYNIEVADFHTYYATDFGLLVHNECDVGANVSQKRWTQTEVEGRRVYQRNDLIDPSRVDSEGRSNLQRMRSGNAPIGSDGEEINLHHLTQDEPGPVVELRADFHSEHSNQLHMYRNQYDKTWVGKDGIRRSYNSAPGKLDRRAFGKWKTKYWKSRANDFEETEE